MEHLKAKTLLPMLKMSVIANSCSIQERKIGLLYSVMIGLKIKYTYILNAKKRSLRSQMLIDKEYEKVC